MEDVNLWTETPEYLSVLWNIVLLVLPTLASLAVASATGASVVKAARWFWRTVRPLVDEPGDPLVQYLAQKSGRNPADIQRWLIARGDEVIALLPAEAAPIPER